MDEIQKITRRATSRMISAEDLQSYRLAGLDREEDFAMDEINSERPANLKPGEKWGQKGIDPEDCKPGKVVDRYQAELDRLANVFTYHAPKGDQADRYEVLRANARSLAEFIVGKCPESRERSLALTKLEEAIFWANASIARNE